MNNFSNELNTNCICFYTVDIPCVVGEAGFLVRPGPGLSGHGDQRRTLPARETAFTDPLGKQSRLG